jgi:hypothetical protein
MKSRVFGRNIFGLFLTHLKLLTDTTAIVTIFLLMEGVEVTAENDLNGRHFNYVAFHVSINNILKKRIYEEMR